jgi:hypothetical protein
MSMTVTRCIGQSQTGDVSTTKDFVLLPNADCGFQNHLAIDGFDTGSYLHVLMEVTYNDKTWQTGIAPDILLAAAANVNDAQWYLKASSDPIIWKQSNKVFPCPTDYFTAHSNNAFKPSTHGLWVPDCTETEGGKVKHVYVKLVIPTACGCRCGSRCGN